MSNKALPKLKSISSCMICTLPARRDDALEFVDLTSEAGLFLSREIALPLRPSSTLGDAIDAQQNKAEEAKVTNGVRVHKSCVGFLRAVHESAGADAVALDDSDPTSDDVVAAARFTRALIAKLMASGKLEAPIGKPLLTNLQMLDACKAAVDEDGVEVIYQFYVALCGKGMKTQGGHELPASMDRDAYDAQLDEALTNEKNMRNFRYWLEAVCSGISQKYRGSRGANTIVFKFKGVSNSGLRVMARWKMCLNTGRDSRSACAADFFLWGETRRG